MELDQFIFKKLYSIVQKRRQNTAFAEHGVFLEHIAPKLTLMARAITGLPININASEREGGWQGLVFYLPESISLFSTQDLNLKLYLFRLFYLAIQMQLRIAWRETQEGGVRQRQQAAAEQSTPVLDKLFEEYPAMRQIYHELLAAWPEAPKTGSKDLSWLYGRLMRYEEPNIKNRKTLNNISPFDRKLAEQVRAETTIKAKKADEVKIISVDKKAQEDYMLTHNFEKIETVDEFDGTWRDFDGDNSLSNDQEALRELNLRHLVRVDDPVHSVYQADMLGTGTPAEAGETEPHQKHVLYPEWDYLNNTYKQDYCTVYPRSLSASDPLYYQNTIKHNRRLLIQLKKNFAILNNARLQKRRQVMGENVDLDAVTDMFADIHARHTPSEKLYIGSRKGRKELAILFLLDLSLSSDAYANGNRILDVEKQVSILFGEVFTEFEIDFQIDGFYSKTRNNTTYLTLKSFDENWNNCRFRIGAVEATGYTRIGSALRHGASLLKQNAYRKKWLILLSDGKPNDYDRYEGRYGIEDIKQAIREMRRDGIHNFAFAIEEEARYYLPQMFGENHYNILTSPVELLNALTKLYARIERN